MVTASSHATNAASCSDEDSDSDEEVILFRHLNLNSNVGEASSTRRDGGGGACAHTAHTAALLQKRVLVIIDLNGLLVDRVYLRGAHHHQKKHILAAEKAGGKVVGKYLVHVRRGLLDFIRFAAERFELMVWSSARLSNIESLTDAFFPEDVELIRKWGQDKCVCVQPHPTNPKKPCLFLKVLSDLWEQDARWNKTNTVLIDDSIEKASRNPPFTSIHPREWGSAAKDDAALLPGGAIRECLSELYQKVVVAGEMTVPEYLKSQQYLDANEGT